MTRSTFNIVCVASAALFIAVACNSTPTNTNTNADLSVGGDAAFASLDFSTNGDLAQTPSCGSLEAYCADPSKLCWGSWANAGKASSWCQPGFTGSIYITTTPCGQGYQAVSIVSAGFTPVTGRSFFYKIDASGALAAVGEYDPDQGDVTCLAGPTTLGYNIAASGCQYANPVECVNGVLQ